MSIYSNTFFAGQRQSSLASARVIVPIALELVEPRSVVDVGCGVGTWLAAFAEHGLADFVGVDGHYVERSQLAIPPDCFIAHDLTKPLDLGRTFDLALSLEVGEHLPAATAETFVDSLTRLAPVVLFSAAVPGQGGVQHVNEQWPEYWARLFAKRGFVAVDAVRPRVWHLEDVDFWYAQNTVLFARRTALCAHPRLESELDIRGELMSIVHPTLYLAVRRVADELTPRQILRELPRAIRRTARRRFRYS
jgi:SAM-dependent methyltransferase